MKNGIHGFRENKLWAKVMLITSTFGSFIGLWVKIRHRNKSSCSEPYTTWQYSLKTLLNSQLCSTYMPIFPKKRMSMVPTTSQIQTLLYAWVKNWLNNMLCNFQNCYIGESNQAAELLVPKPRKCQPWSYVVWKDWFRTVCKRPTTWVRLERSALPLKMYRMISTATKHVSCRSLSLLVQAG